MINPMAIVILILQFLFICAALCSFGIANDSEPSVKKAWNLIIAIAYFLLAIHLNEILKRISP